MTKKKKKKKGQREKTRKVMKERGRVQEVEKVEIGGEKRWPSGLVAGREKLRRTSVFGTYLPLAIGAIYSGCKASLSFGEWTFSLKVAFTRLGQRDHYPSTGFRRKRARRGGHLNTRNSRPDHVNTEAPRHVDKAHPVPHRASPQLR